MKKVKLACVGCSSKSTLKNNISVQRNNVNSEIAKNIHRHYAEEPGYPKIDRWIAALVVAYKILLLLYWLKRIP